jgi:hypothetical protein
MAHSSGREREREGGREGEREGGREEGESDSYHVLVSKTIIIYVAQERKYSDSEFGVRSVFVIIFIMAA